MPAPQPLERPPICLRIPVRSCRLLPESGPEGRRECYLPMGHTIYEDDLRYRHEVKFVVSLESANRFLEEIRWYCDGDPHAGPDLSYEIASLYFDTADFRFYWDREESVGFRRKVRLRSYNSDSAIRALFLEIKEKHKRFVAKKRAAFEGTPVLGGIGPHSRLRLKDLLESLPDSWQKREISYLDSRFRLEPVTIIRYLRRAFVPRFENDMRITLDTGLTAGGDDLSVFREELETPLLPPSSAVLEIKTNRSIPLWLHAALLRQGFFQVRFSKYCLAVQAIYRPHRKILMPSMGVMSHAVIS